MEKRYLLDTNIAIYFLQGRLTSKAAEFLKLVLTTKPNLSIISKIELLGWDEDVDASTDFVASSVIFQLDDNIVETCIEIRKKHRIKIPDAIIAATSLATGMELVTRNVSDFKRIKELNWTNPFED